MDNHLKHEIRILGILIPVAAVIPLLNLTIALLPDIIRQMVLLIIISYPLCCFFILVWGTFIIRELPCKKLLRKVIFIAWLTLYPLLCCGWAALVIFVILPYCKTFYL